MGRNRRRHHLPLLAGWVFADLLLALALVFLGTERPPPAAPGPEAGEDESAGTDEEAEAEEGAGTTTTTAPALEPKTYAMAWDGPEHAAVRDDVLRLGSDPASALRVRDAIGRWFQGEGLDQRRFGIVLIFTNQGAGSSSTALSDEVAEILCQGYPTLLGLEQAIPEGEGVARCGSAAPFIRTYFTEGQAGVLEIELLAYQR